MKYEGGCHCGAVRLVFETALDPREIPVRACQCSFCRKHNTLAITDPGGRMTVAATPDRTLNRYVFGLETAEYLLCRDCGVYVAAVTRGEPRRGLVILNCLDGRKRFTAEPVETVYDHETVEARKARRARSWTPFETG